MLYLTGQSLILLHHFLILLVYTEHLTDPVGSRLCLRAQGTTVMLLHKQSNTVGHAQTDPLSLSFNIILILNLLKI